MFDERLATALVLPRSLPASEDVSYGLKDQIKIKTHALVALIDQIQPGLGGDADAGIDRIGLFRGLAAGQERGLMFVIGNRGQTGDTGA